MDVCAETTLVITNSPQTFTCEGYGLKLIIPEGCLPPGTEHCTISIKASVSGEYKFPDDSHPVSAIFWIHCEPSCKFTLPISVEMQHCAKSKDVSKLNFVKAHCSQASLPYCFQKLQGSRFTNENDYSFGAVDLTSFSGVCVVQDEPQDQLEMEYVARLFYLSLAEYVHEIHLVITWNTELHLTVSVATLNPLYHAIV